MSFLTLTRINKIFTGMPAVEDFNLSANLQQWMDLAVFAAITASG